MEDISSLFAPSPHNAEVSEVSLMLYTLITLIQTQQTIKYLHDESIFHMHLNCMIIKPPESSKNFCLYFQMVRIRPVNKPYETNLLSKLQFIKVTKFGRMNGPDSSSPLAFRDSSSSASISHFIFSSSIPAPSWSQSGLRSSSIAAPTRSQSGTTHEKHFTSIHCLTASDDSHFFSPRLGHRTRT